MRIPYRGAGALLVCNGKILVGERGKDDPPFRGCWCMPGGGKEKNETYLEAALRELYEEAGVRFTTAEDAKPYGSWTLKLPLFRWTCFFFKVDQEYPLKLKEFSKLGWYDISYLKNKKLRPFLRSELKAAGFEI